MSSMPTNVAASALQAGVQQQTAGVLQDGEHNRIAHMARQADRKSIQRENDIVADESDLTVNSEGGGAGQGREFSESHGEGHTATGEQEGTNASAGITTDSRGQVHIDIEA
jgi:hypothetical protein